MARLGLVLVLAAIAYHGLVLWDPGSQGFGGVIGWFFEASDSSPQLVFGIVAGLLFRRRSQLRDALGRATSPVLGTLCLVSAVGSHIWAQWVAAPDLMVVSLGLVVLGAALFAGGRPLARELVAPLAILVLAIPLPGAFYNSIVYRFQLTTAGFADAVLRSVGFDVALHGDILSLAGRDWEVIESCSGLRSAQTLALLACAWVAFFRCPAWHTLCLLAASPVIAFLTNGIRALVLVLDARPEVQHSHVTQGVVMLVVGSLALGLVDRALLRLGASERRALPAAPARRAVRAHDLRGVAGVALALLVMAAATLWLPPLRPSAPELPPPPELPRELAGWSVRDGPDSGLFLGNVRFTHRSNLFYERGREFITAFLGWDDRQLRMRSLLSDKNAVPGLGWEIEQRGHVDFEPGKVRMGLVVARRFAERSLTVHAYWGASSVLEETLRGALALDQPGSPFARRERLAVLRLSTPVEPGPQGLRHAEESLRSLFAELAPAVFP